jgi:hypothetical protein
VQVGRITTVDCYRLAETPLKQFASELLREKVNGADVQRFQTLPTHSVIKGLPRTKGKALCRWLHRMSQIGHPAPEVSLDAVSEWNLTADVTKLRKAMANKGDSLASKIRFDSPIEFRCMVNQTSIVNP